MTTQPEFDATDIYRRGNEILARLRSRSRARVFIISGPSGVGKDAVLDQLKIHHPEWKYVVTCTTRPMRPGEIDGVHYTFLSAEAFLDGIERNEFLEHALVYDNHYGVPRTPVVEGLAENRDVVIKVDVKGHATLKSLISGAISIFIAPESTETLHEFLKNRKTEPPDVLQKRLRISSEELERVDEFDYLVTNRADRLDETITCIHQIIDTERLKVHHPDIILK
jgi:guanylate kinase